MKKITVCLILIAMIVTACSSGKITPTLSIATATPLLAFATTASNDQPVIPTPTALQISGTTDLRPAVPYEMISKESLLAYLSDLTSIQPYSGWRSAGSSGEAEAHDYVADQLARHQYLAGLGMAIERPAFPIYLSVEFKESRLLLTIGGSEVEVPASALRGSRYDTNLAQNFDSDGRLNDDQADPVTASGQALIIGEMDRLDELTEAEVAGKILFLDYSLIDYFITQDISPAAQLLGEVIAKKPAGLILLTQYSNALGVSHGTVIGDGGIFQRYDFQPDIPILHARLEDLAPAGINSWEDLSKIDNARLVWDTDVFSPGKSGNLIARIPGVDSSHAVILGAHIDSPNGPGAFDNGSGSATLLEIARILDQAHIQPPVDLYLAWFGSHELGIYGSANFVATHQELLDQTLAMLQMDCIGYPIDGSQPQILAETWSYGQFGDERLQWPDYLAEKVRSEGVELETENTYSLLSDNSNFNAFNVPNLNLEYFDYGMMRRGPYDVHYLNHLHDPYETMELATELGDVLEGMAKVALAAALETGAEQPDLRSTETSHRRALLIASHTEPGNVAPTALFELGMALAWEGFDVDLIPFGQAITAPDLENAGVVVLLPTLDYPGTEDNLWSDAETALIDQYASQGGFLIVTASYNNLSMNRLINEVNEDNLAINALTERMGIRFKFGVLNAENVNSISKHPLMENAGYLKMFANNGVPFELAAGEVLATANVKPIIGLVDYGDSGGQVLVVGDIGLLVDFGRDAKNLDFVKNIAQYVRQR